uniref:Uncharacterized protein n=1 Tax=Myotis myotis TaxID=51298 RepID=A0A7J7TJL3_MYOMY|nr:hypothetical protein mMyoMyo1_009020 [Myotis myotis]
MRGAGGEPNEASCEGAAWHGVPGPCPSRGPSPAPAHRSAPGSAGPPAGVTAVAGGGRERPTGMRRGHGDCTAGRGGVTVSAAFQIDQRLGSKLQPETLSLNQLFALRAHRAASTIPPGMGLGAFPHSYSLRWGQDRGGQ